MPQLNGWLLALAQDAAWVAQRRSIANGAALALSMWALVAMAFAAIEALRYSSTPKRTQDVRNLRAGPALLSGTVADTEPSPDPTTLPQGTVCRVDVTQSGTPKQRDAYYSYRRGVIPEASWTEWRVDEVKIAARPFELRLGAGATVRVDPGADVILDWGRASHRGLRDLSRTLSGKLLDGQHVVIEGDLAMEPTPTISRTSRSPMVIRQGPAASASLQRAGGHLMFAAVAAAIASGLWLDNGFREFLPVESGTGTVLAHIVVQCVLMGLHAITSGRLAGGRRAIVYPYDATR
ncbi:MAG: hypothetical protein WCJ30_28550 [Deltaproteobacteria bacterium]